MAVTGLLSCHTYTALKRNKYDGAVQGFVVEAGERLGPAAKKFIDEVDVMATLIQELRNEEQ